MNNTMQDTQLATLTIKASDALDLFSGAIVCAGGKDSPIQFAGVYLSAADNKLVAASSDRFRLIAGSLSVESAPNFENIGLGVADIKRIITTLKDLKTSIRLHDLTLSIAGDIVSVAVNGVSLTLNATGYKFPPYNQLFTNDSAALTSISFNPAYMAEFGKVPNSLSDKKSQLIMEFSGEDKPIRVRIPHDRIEWRALLMPMRVSA